MSEEKPINNGFGILLQDLRKGQALDEVSEKMDELVRAVRETGKAGSLTLNIKVKPAGKGDGTTVLVEDDVKSKPPQHSREAIFFSTQKGRLTRDNPNQRTLKFEPMEGQAEEEPSQEEKEAM